MTKKTTVIEVNEEPEIQLDAGSPELLAEIQAWVEARGALYKKTVNEPATYWDTHNFRLAREAIEYRIKSKGDEYRHDMKTPMDTANNAVVRDDHDVLWRRELKYTTKTQQPSLAIFNGVSMLQPIAARVQKFFGKTLELKCEADLTKAKYDILVPGDENHAGRVEYAFQSGNMFADARRLKSRDLYLVELERRSGSIEALHSEYADIMQAFRHKGLKILPIRKMFIGFELLVPQMDEKQRRCFYEAWVTNYDMPDSALRSNPASQPLVRAA